MVRWMRKWDLVVLVAGLVVGLGAVGSGCTPEGPAEACSIDEECRGDRVCDDGRCQFGDDEAEPVPDGGDDATVDAGVACLRVDGLTCWEWEEYRTDTCRCEPISCTDREQCNGFACKQGTCGRCEADVDCGEARFCSPSGECTTEHRCEEDVDCPAHQACSDDGECEDRDGCVLDADCGGDQELCVNGRCTRAPDCEVDDDCSAGMECIGGRCFEEVCRGPEDCEDGEVCEAGECIEPPSAESCFVATPNGEISEDERIRLEAFARDADGEGVPASFEWSSTNPSVATIGDSGRHAVGGSSSGTTILRAELSDGIECDGSVELHNPGTIGEEGHRVIVSDTNTRSPIEGAEVVLGDGSATTTSAGGVATFQERPSGSYTVSVFHPDYNYLTLKGVESNDLRLPLTPSSGEGPVAGFTGQFDTSQINTSGDVTLGLAGTSISGGMLDLGLEQLLGEPFVNELQTPQGTQEVPLPAGMIAHGQVAGFDVDLKQTYYATSAGGARLGWGLAGEVSGTRLFEIFQDGENPLAVLLPLFNRFDHATRPLQLSERPRVQDSMDIDGDGDTTEMIPDYTDFQQVDLQPSVRQNLVTEVSVSNFPQLPDGEAELAVLLGANVLDSAGLVPLGISATNDENGDGAPDVRNLYMAPPHGSITGGRYAVMALAFRTDGFSPSGGLELPDNLSAALWTRQTLPNEVGLGTFPDATDATVDESARSVELSTDAGPMYRFQFVGTDRTWEVWTSGPPGSMGSYEHTATIPEMPGGRTDLFAAGEKSMVDAVEVQVTLDDLAEPTGVGLREIGLVATAFNRTVIE